MREQSAYELLKSGLEILDISFTEEQANKFTTYLAELKKWNRAYNLTGLKTDREIIIKHFLDSLLFLKVFPPDIKTVADIGSGAGFPGIPIKIIRPDLKIYLIEPTQKKALFLRHISANLGLENLEVINSRIEDIKEIRVDLAMTRALFSVGELIEKARGPLNKSGILILSKGPKLHEELKGLDKLNVEIKDLQLPFEDIVRHMVVVRA